MKPSIKQVLVTFDSRLGSTAEVAIFIGGVLSECDVIADVRPLSDVDDLTAYDRVIIGSAIRYDRWLPDAVAFTRAYQQALRKKPVALFFTCLTLANPTPDAVRKAAAYADQISNLVPWVQPLSVGRFAGVLKFAGTPWPMRLVLRTLSLATGVKEGDYRDWDAIRDWAQSQLVQN